MTMAWDTPEGKAALAAAMAAGYNVAGVMPQMNASQQSTTPAYGAQPVLSTSTGTLPVSTANQPYAAATPAVTGGSPSVANWEAQQNLLQARQQLIGTQQANAALQPSAAAAQSNVLSAQNKQVDAQRAYLAEQQRFNEQKRADELAVQAAAQNPTDILTVARAQYERNQYGYRYNIAGLPAPIEVKLPPGYTGPIPVGVMQRLQTMAEVMADKFKDRETLDAFNIEAARIKSANTGLEVSAAQIASGKVQLSLDEAEAAMQRAQMLVSQSELAVQASTQPPAPGLVWDDIAQEWVNPAVLDQRKAQYSQAQENLGGQYASFSQSELMEMYSRGLLDDTAFTAEFRRRGFREDTITSMMLLAQARRQATADLSGFGGAPGGTVPTTAAGATLNPNVPSANPSNNAAPFAAGAEAGSFVP